MCVCMVCACARVCGWGVGESESWAKKHEGVWRGWNDCGVFFLIPRKGVFFFFRMTTHPIRWFSFSGGHGDVCLFFLCFLVNEKIVEIERMVFALLSSS